MAKHAKQPPPIAAREEPPMIAAREQPPETPALDLPPPNKNQQESMCNDQSCQNQDGFSYNEVRESEDGDCINLTLRDDENAAGSTEIIAQEFKNVVKSVYAKLHRKPTWNIVQKLREATGSFKNSNHKRSGNFGIHSEANRRNHHNKVLEGGKGDQMITYRDEHTNPENKMFMDESTCRLQGKQGKQNSDCGNVDLNSWKNELPRPTNRVTFCLDGTEDEVLVNYQSVMDHIEKWNYYYGIKRDASAVSGTDREVYTTAEYGTLYVIVTYDGDSIVFVIEGRAFWLKGLLDKHGLFDLEPDKGEKAYIRHPSRQELRFKGNHRFISDGDPGRTKLGLYALINAFKCILLHRGKKEPENFRTSIGVFVVYLCEAAKLQAVFKAICSSFVNSNINRLDTEADWMKTLIRMWSKFSKVIMESIDAAHKGEPAPEIPKDHGIPNMDTIEGILEAIKMLHLNASDDDGLFKHNPPEDPYIWQQMDKREGDPDFFNVLDFGEYNNREMGKEKKNKKKQTQALVSYPKKGGRGGGQPFMSTDKAKFSTMVQLPHGIGATINMPVSMRPVSSFAKCMDIRSIRSRYQFNKPMFNEEPPKKYGTVFAVNTDPDMRNQNDAVEKVIQRKRMLCAEWLKHSCKKPVGTNLGLLKCTRTNAPLQIPVSASRMPLQVIPGRDLPSDEHQQHSWRNSVGIVSDNIHLLGRFSQPSYHQTRKLLGHAPRFLLMLKCI